MQVQSLSPSLTDPWRRENRKTGTVNILKAYSVKDDVIGYAQGVNYVAAALIYVGMEEEVGGLEECLESGYWM